MLDLRECLFVTFTYDHAAGIFYAQLANGTRIPVERQHVSGRLANALELHKKAVIDLNSGKYVQARGNRGQLTYSYNEEQVKRYTAAGYRDVELPPLELELGDLEL